MSNDIKFTHAMRCKQHLEKQLNLSELWIVFNVDVRTLEVIDIGCETALTFKGLPDQSHEYQLTALLKGLIELFIHRLDKHFLAAIQPIDFTHFNRQFDLFLDTLRDAEGRVFL
ncbi:hypothetical protein [Methylomonas koyamae]|uniref:hypothetical protein n=1 Tax=Methylomonas koyamae TaxID=702114 RepID=UPI001129796E|nr:hypothetical protein [Methylomonas koyamae]TPQ28962.1 hypothetical protein C2U68_03100 [Methylomonas koyamae]